MNISPDLLRVLWRFVNEDTEPRVFESWLYANAQTLETTLGNSLYINAIETDFGNRESLFQLKKQLRTFTTAHDQSTCQCLRHPDLTIIDMGEHEEFFSTLQTIRKRGEPYWWLFAADCSNCGESWLVAQEERHNDIFILRRLNPAEREAIMSKNHWPSDFDHFETLLRIGENAGRSVGFVDPLNSSLVQTIIDLAESRPGIRVSELTSLLNVSSELAVALVKKAQEIDSLNIKNDVTTEQPKKLW